MDRARHTLLVLAAFLLREISLHVGEVDGQVEVFKSIATCELHPV